MYFYKYFSLNMQGGITKSELAAACEWVKDCADKQRTWSDANEINKMELEQGRLWSFHVSKEVPFWGETPPTTTPSTSGKAVCSGALLQYLYTNAHSIGSNHEICVRL